MAVRVATFNVENLFSRPKVLNFEVEAKATPILNRISKLQALIDKETYFAADKQQIAALANELDEYVEVKEIRRKLFAGMGAKRYVKVDGRREWVGGLDYRRETFSYGAQVSTAKVLREVDADVVCLVEVENRLTLAEFATAHLKNQRYRYNMAIDGNDDRGIDLGLLSRLPLDDLRSHIHDRASPNARSRIFSRDCLEAEVQLASGKPLWMLLNHFKSKGYGQPAANNARRRVQAMRVAELVSRFDLKDDHVCVAGDLNDTPDSAPLQPLFDAGLKDVLAAAIPSPKDRWTYKSKEQIDYLLVSPALLKRMTAAGVERRGLADAKKLAGVDPFPSVTNDRTDASDHGAVWADFDV